MTNFLCANLNFVNVYVLLSWRSCQRKRGLLVRGPATGFAWLVHIIRAAEAAMNIRKMARIPLCQGLELSKVCQMHLWYSLCEDNFHMTRFSVTNFFQ